MLLLHLGGGKSWHLSRSENACNPPLHDSFCASIQEAWRLESHHSMRGLCHSKLLGPLGGLIHSGCLGRSIAWECERFVAVLHAYLGTNRRPSTPLVIAHFAQAAYGLKLKGKASHRKALHQFPHSVPIVFQQRLVV